MKKASNPKWTIVETAKDMPKKSGDYLMWTTAAVPFTFHWDCKKKQMYVYGIRNHYNKSLDEYVDDGKVDWVKYDYETYCEFIWTPLKLPRKYFTTKF